MKGKLIIAGFQANFLEEVKEESRQLLVVSIPPFYMKFRPYLPKVHYYYDLLNPSDKLGERLEDGAERVDENWLQSNKEPLSILVCINDSQIYEQVCLLFTQLQCEGKIYDLFNNCAFPFIEDKKYCYEDSGRPLRVRLINYEGSGWILTKFATRMNEQLNRLGILSDIGDTVDPDADINHHIPYHQYLPFRAFNDTLMITHVDSGQKITMLKEQLKTARLGICMSKETVSVLAQAGVPRKKLCYVNPAHDGNIYPKKYVIGITHRCYDTYDLRKRASSLLDMLEGINPVFFKFIIMGSGWDRIVEVMRNRELEVDYYPKFEYGLYHELISVFDYYLYFGFDEGSMGFLDALAAGVKTIVTPQGFHLDVPDGIDFPCRTVEQFTEVFYNLQYERERRIASVAGWTWENYAKKHVEIWSYLTGRSPLKQLYQNQLWYEDGIFSCYINDNCI